MNRFPSVPSVSDFVGPMLCPQCDLPLANGHPWWEVQRVIDTPTLGRRVIGEDPEGVVSCANQGCSQGDMFLAFHAMSEDSEAVIRDLLKAVKRGQSWRVEPLARRLQDVSDDYVIVDKWDLELLLQAAAYARQVRRVESSTATISAAAAKLAGLDVKRKRALGQVSQVKRKSFETVLPEAFT